MLTDRYDNPISTTSQAARDAYIDGVDRFLGAAPDAAVAFDRAIAADPDFALAHMGKARTFQVIGRGTEAQAARQKSIEVANGVTGREKAHLGTMDLLIQGRAGEAYPQIRAHVDAHPRDVMVAQTCTSVFGLIGFSGQPGREAEQLAYTTKLLPHYGDDWWLLSMHAFAQAEAGQVGPAAETIERSLQGNPRSAHGAHIKAHIHYEAGETDTGFAYMRDWYRDYPREGALHCHISWHIALWALESGDLELMWKTIDDAVAPGSAWGPPINVLSDTAAILYRAELAGVTVPPDRWKAISDYAATFFPKPGIAFADMHAALAHAMAGNGEALQKIVDDAVGPAGDLVSLIATAFGALAGQDWDEAIALLTRAMADHARMGGSRAQRDLLEYALLNALLKQGHDARARMLLALRRPLKADAHAVAGL